MKFDRMTVDFRKAAVQFKVVSDPWVGRNRMSVQDFECKIFEITYVLSGWGLKNGYVVFGI